MNIAICDDDSKCVENIFNLLQEYVESEQLDIYTYYSGEDFVAELDKENMRFDIVFLDIEMSGLSGIDVARRLRERDNKTIIFFVTIHLNYVSDTFRLGAFQFLVKPIDKDTFTMDFERAIKSYKNDHQIYSIRWRDFNYVIDYGDIYYIEGYKRHLYVHTDYEKYECVGMMADEERKLIPYNFARCHQGFLINLAKVKEINKTDLTLNNGTVIPISRRYKEKLLESFNLFLAGRMI